MAPSLLLVLPEGLSRFVLLMHASRNSDRRDVRDG